MPDLFINIVRLCRVSQWLKNLMLFFPPFFAGTLFGGYSPSALFVPFASFCLLSSSSYIFNDIIDADTDRHHPDKNSRGIASGAVSIRTALVVAVLLITAGVLLAWSVSSGFTLLAAAYVMTTVLYSLKLKQLLFADILSICTCFLLRLSAGWVAFDIAPSGWLFVTVFLLAAFLSAGKRLAEKQRLGEKAIEHRRSLVAYPSALLQKMMLYCTLAVLATYTMFLLSLGRPILLASIPLCCYGLFRYIQRIRSGSSGDPTESLVLDMPLFMVGAAWTIITGWGLYGG